MTPLIAIGLILVALLLYLVSRRVRADTGLPDGEVMYSDTGAWQRNERALFSKQHRLSGKPDYLIRVQGAIVPVEVKSGKAPAQPRAGHVLQLAAYCLLVEEALAAPVHEGIIKYDDRQFVIRYDAERKRELLTVLREMRQDLTAGAANRDHSEPRRCRACGVREKCDQSLI